MSDKITVRRVVIPSDTDLDRAASLVVSGFDYDAFTMACVGGHRDLAHMFFRMQMAAGTALYFASVGPDTDVGVAMWTEPGQEVFDTLQSRPDLGLPEFMACLGPHAREWWMSKFIPAVDALNTSTLGPDTKKNAWHLQLFVVDERYRRKGVGRALLQPILDKAREEGQNTTVGTQCPENIPVYESLGFELKGHGMMPGGDQEDFPLYYFGGKHKQYN